MKISKQTRDLVYFMSIGDGTINKNGYLAIRHALKQKEYLIWKKELLNKYGIRTANIYYCDNNGYGAYELRTYTHNFIKLLRKVLYKPKKDFLESKQLSKISSLGLAIWYMDDGGLSRKKLMNGTYSIKELMLNTGLLKNDNQILIDYFKNVWNINFSQVKNNSVYRLRCGKKEAEKFIKIISSHVEKVQCMKYKIDVNSY